MYTFFLMIHLFISLLLVIVILLQSGKGGGLASAFGGTGTGEAVFGGRQAATFLSKATTVLGTMFFLSAFGLALLSSYLSGPRSVVQDELLQSSPVPVTQPAPVTAAPSETQLFPGQPQQQTSQPQQAPEGGAAPQKQP